MNKHQLYTSEYVCTASHTRGVKTLPWYTSVQATHSLWSLLFILSCPSLPASPRPHHPHQQVPGPLFRHLTLTPHHPVPSCYDMPHSALEINYLGCPDFKARWLCVCLWAALAAATVLLVRAIKPPHKWLKPMTQLPRRQRPRVSLLQVLHFNQRYKQTHPPSYSFVSLANSRNNQPRSCTWHIRLCLSCDGRSR